MAEAFEIERKTPAEIIGSIRERRDGQDQARGDLAALQSALEEHGQALADLDRDDLARIYLQCGYALGYRHGSAFRGPQLRLRALAWLVVDELAFRFESREDLT
jgi:hypothetical protein